MKLAYSDQPTTRANIYQVEDFLFYRNQSIIVLKVVSATLPYNKYFQKLIYFAEVFVCSVFCMKRKKLQDHKNLRLATLKFYFYYHGINNHVLYEVPPSDTF